jgi:hypothetical protein
MTINSEGLAMRFILPGADCESVDGALVVWVAAGLDEDARRGIIPRRNGLACKASQL